MWSILHFETLNKTAYVYWNCDWMILPFAHKVKLTFFFNRRSSWKRGKSIPQTGGKAVKVMGVEAKRRVDQMDWFGKIIELSGQFEPRKLKTFNEIKTNSNCKDSLSLSLRLSHYHIAPISNLSLSPLISFCFSLSSPVVIVVVAIVLHPNHSLTWWWNHIQYTCDVVCFSVFFCVMGEWNVQFLAVP